MSVRKRVGDDVVASELKSANGLMTMQQLASKLGMKETTLRAQVSRIKSKVTAFAAESGKTVDFPEIKDGRSASNESNAESLLSIFS